MALNTRLTLPKVLKKCHIQLASNTVISMPELKSTKVTDLNTNMTKKLEDILNLPNVKEAFKEVDSKEKAKEEKANGKSKNLDPETHKNLQKSYAEFDKVAAALPQVKGLGELSDLELDKLAVEAEESYKNLMDLGMNVDSRYSGRIFEVASTMLRNAIDAKSNKIDKKLKMVELQLKKMKIDQSGDKDMGTVEESEGFVISDRNDLMKKLLKKD
tara:strand:- start:15 stop:659 length:645 start_codon:yes stop_codon:yes gene_type:complete